VRELVALRVAAEVVVVVEDQDPRVGPRLLVEPGRAEPADARPNDDEVVLFARIGRRAGGLPEGGAVTELVQRLEGAHV
jgi:hypothetical protein